MIKEFRRAKCMYYPKGSLGDYVVDSYKNRTQEMLRHINSSNKYYPGNISIDKNQKVMAGDKIQRNKLKMIAYKPDKR